MVGDEFILIPGKYKALVEYPDREYTNDITISVQEEGSHGRYSPAIAIGLPRDQGEGSGWREGDIDADSSHGQDANWAAAYGEALQIAGEWLLFIQDATESWRQEVEDRESRLAEEARKAAEERARVIKEREERCMWELADEPVRVRCRGYKGAVRAHIRIRTREETEGDRIAEVHYPWIDYDHPNDYNRPRMIKDVAKLEHKQSGYVLIWDDGKDDLPTYDR